MAFSFIEILPCIEEKEEEKNKINHEETKKRRARRKEEEKNKTNHEDT
jgi:hypothetical protein